MREDMMRTLTGLTDEIFSRFMKLIDIAPTISAAIPTFRCRPLDVRESLRQIMTVIFAYSTDA